MGIALLAGAIACEVFATTMMKLSMGFTVLPASIACVVGYIACFGLLGRALLHIDLGVSYAVWAGLGIVATTSRCRCAHRWRCARSSWSRVLSPADLPCGCSRHPSRGRRCSTYAGSRA